MESDSDEQDVLYQHDDERDKILRSANSNQQLRSRISAKHRENMKKQQEELKREYEKEEDDENQYLHAELENLLADSINFSQKISASINNKKLSSPELTELSNNISSNKDEHDDHIRFISPTYNKTIKPSQPSTSSRNSSIYIPEDENDFFNSSFDITPKSINNKKRKIKSIKKRRNIDHAIEHLKMKKNIPKEKISSIKTVKIKKT